MPTAQERQGDFSGARHAAAQPGGRRRAVSRAISCRRTRSIRSPATSSNLYPLGNVSPSIYRETLIGRNELDQVGGRRRLQRVAVAISCSAATRTPAATTSTRSRCAARTCRAIRRATISRRTRRWCRARDIFSPSLTNSLRATWLRHKFLFDQRLNRTPPRELGFGYDSANDARAGSAVLQRQRLLADWRRHHRPAQLDADDVRGAGQRDVDARRASGQGRRRAPPQRHRHGPGDRAERVLRVRVDLPHEQRGRQPAAGRAGHLLSGARRLQPRAALVERRRSTRRTNGVSAAA